MDKHFLIMKPELLVQLFSFSNGGEEKKKQTTEVFREMQFCGL